MQADDIGIVNAAENPSEEELFIPVHRFSLGISLSPY